MSESIAFTTSCRPVARSDKKAPLNSMTGSRSRKPRRMPCIDTTVLALATVKSTPSSKSRFSSARLNSDNVAELVNSVPSKSEM